MPQLLSKIINIINMNIIIRILGNDLNGIHSNNQTIENLKFTLINENEFVNTDKLYILNRIL